MRQSMDIADTRFRIESPLTLGENYVHLWRVDLEATASDEARWSTILSTDERTRAARFHFPVDRQYYTAGRALLRQVLAAYLSTDPAALTFVYSSKDKPALGGAHAASGLAFNISHSGGIALFAVTRARQIGVDVEHIRYDLDPAAIATRFFSEAEQEQLSALPADQRHQAFFRCWTRKEAYIKATGEGLSLPLSQFDVSLVADDRDALLATRPDAHEAELWSMRDVAVKPGFVAALCVSGTGWRLIDWSGE
jgi:4'-phosphopantetheinyl transferase